MAVTAVLFAIVTVLVGVVALGDVVTSQAGSGLRRLAIAHVAFALTGVVFLLVAVVGVSRGPAWVSLIVLLLAGFLGLTTLAFTRRPSRLSPDAVPKARVALPVVIVHGAAAVITLLTVLAAAAGSGLVRH
jgi:hypothetical protein